MEKILSSFFCFLKYILLIAAFGLVFYGLMVTLGRLEKSILDGVEFIIPFAILFILFIINLFVRSKKYISDNLLFNFVCCVVFAAIILVSLRAMYDSGMTLYDKYDINFNPAYFSDNLSVIKTMLYLLCFVNVSLLVCYFVDREKKTKKPVIENLVDEDNV